MSILFMLLNLKIRYGILIATTNSFGNALGISYDFSNIFDKYSKTRIVIYMRFPIYLRYVDILVDKTVKFPRTQ